jgi:hypothetical protein
MNLIIRPARGGKTVELVKLSAETGKYIVCANMSQVDNIQRIANWLGVKIPFPIMADELPIKGHIDSVLIDNADELLERLIGRPVIAATITGVQYTPFLHNNPEYIDQLRTYDPQEYKAMYYGEWKAENPDDSGIESALEDMP